MKNLCLILIVLLLQSCGSSKRPEKPSAAADSAKEESPEKAVDKLQDSQNSADSSKTPPVIGSTSINLKGSLKLHKPIGKDNVEVFLFEESSEKSDEKLKQHVFIIESEFFVNKDKELEVKILSLDGESKEHKFKSMDELKVELEKAELVDHIVEVSGKVEIKDGKIGPEAKRSILVITSIKKLEKIEKPVEKSPEEIAAEKKKIEDAEAAANAAKEKQNVNSDSSPNSNAQEPEADADDEEIKEGDA